MAASLSAATQLRAAPVPGPVRPTAQRLTPAWRPNVRSRAASSSRDAAASAQQESRGMLEAFFIGRALAEVVNERLGAALGDALADFGKWDAETRQAMRELREEVLSRAQREMMAAAGAGDAGAAGSTASGSSSSGAPPPVPDLAAAADDLRAEVASARAMLQQIKQQRRQQQGGQPAQQA
ncbi:hypothetical protein ABPG75_013542 [Micractinium tetrahymenae]